MKVPNEWSKKAKVKLCMTHPAQIDPCFERFFDGVRYTVAFSRETKRITYLYTEDEKFRTADDLRVGDEIAVSEENVRAWPGWQIHGPTTSDGWRPLIGWDVEVKLKDGSVLNLRGKHDGSSSGTATILAFVKGRWNNLAAPSLRSWRKIAISLTIGPSRFRWRVWRFPVSVIAWFRQLALRCAAHFRIAREKDDVE